VTDDNNQLAGRMNGDPSPFEKLKHTQTKRYVTAFFVGLFGLINPLFISDHISAFLFLMGLFIVPLTVLIFLLEGFRRTSELKTVEDWENYKRGSKLRLMIVAALFLCFAAWKTYDPMSDVQCNGNEVGIVEGYKLMRQSFAIYSGKISDIYKSPDYQKNYILLFPERIFKANPQLSIGDGSIQIFIPDDANKFYEAHDNSTYLFSSFSPPTGTYPQTLQCFKYPLLLRLWINMSPSSWISPSIHMVYSCMAAGGSWTFHPVDEGGADSLSSWDCQRPTRDYGKACQSHSDCEGGCWHKRCSEYTTKF
jgi:hypothetical protein